MKPGDCIGPYRLISALGHGGMGEVFAAVHERMHQPVALKILTRLEPSCAARFIQEARALSQLDHPGIVRVLFQGETDDCVPYLVLEQVAGRALREQLREYSCGLPRARGLSLLSGVATAMAAVHERGIVHRDLKPENILVVSQLGGRETIKIIDFGIAHVPPPDRAGLDTWVDTSEMGPRWLGTAGYMAPEQCRQGVPIGAAADVYALGVVLYETLCGRPPFEASDPVELIALHLHAAPDLSALGTGPVRRLASTMLAKQAAARPPMAAVATTLAELAAVESGAIDKGRRTLALSGGALAGAGALLLVGAGSWGLSVLRQLLAATPKKNALAAIARPKKGVLPLQMRPPGLILITHFEKSPVPPAALQAALSPAYQTLPQECVTVPATAAAESGDFTSAAALLNTWFEETLKPLLARYPEYQVVYFGTDPPIPLSIYFGWLLGTFRTIEIRLHHHQLRRFVPWAAVPGVATLLPPRWSVERDESAGDVVVHLSCSYLINKFAARAAVPDSLCEVDLQLASPAADAFSDAAAVEALAEAWKGVCNAIIERFPQVRRIHLFASVQAGVALLLGTRIAHNVHPAIVLYQYAAGVHRPALVVNDPSSRQPALTRGSMDFQTLFWKFHEKIKLKDADENGELRRRRDEILDHLRRHMGERHELKFQWFNSGSYAMGTGVQPVRGADIDIDVGVVFALDHARQDARQLKQWVFSGLPSSLGRVEWRRPCITVFRKDHHIDIGVYTEDTGGLWLTMGQQTEPQVIWQHDGIKLFIEDVRNRFPNPRTDHEQFQRTIRYLKRWKDVNFVGNGVKAPVGLALTVMAYHWFGARSRSGVYNDLAALTDLVERILQHFGARIDLEFPRAPRDNLLRKLSAEQVSQMKGRFQELLKRLQEAASQKSTAPLRRAFGEDFPEV